MSKKINIEKLVRKNILDLKPYSSARDEFSGAEGVFLDANENPFGSWNRYPDPYQKELKNEISKIKNTSSDSLFLGNGSDEVIDLLFRVFTNPGKDQALTFTPTYGMYEVAANINDIELLQISLDENFQVSIDENLQKTLQNEDLKLIFICSPNNPTGNLIQKEAVDFILKNFGGIVVIDEAYIDFADQESWISQLEKHPNLLVMQTFSKYWGMAGLRVGMAFSNPEIISLLNKVKPPYNISSLNQEAVLKTLKNASEINKQLELILKQREQVISALTDLEMVKKIYPTDANFLLAEVENANELYDYLVNEKVIIRNRNSVVKNCVRITIGTPEENKKLIETLQKFE
jgi:histidinol-phosphate aminotransferase